MTLHLIATGEGSENEAARALSEIMHDWYPDIDDDEGTSVWIIANAQCWGQNSQDVDVLVFSAFGPKAPPLPSASGQAPIKVSGLVFTVEVKDNPPERVRSVGTHVEVAYGAGKRVLWKDATQQSLKAPYSVLNYLERVGIRLWIVGLLWFRNVPRKLLPAPPHNILGDKIDWGTLCDRLRASRLAEGPWHTYRKDVIDKAGALFGAPLPSSRLDRKKMELITKTRLQTQQYAKQIGERMLVFRGEGGTGKTIALLQVAHDLFQQKDARVLVLTYNKALVADIRRVFAHIGLTRGVDSGSIHIQTVHSFVRSLAIDAVGYNWIDEVRFEQSYLEAKQALSSVFAGIPQEEIKTYLRFDDGRFTWDFICVDEAQDWPADERDLLFKLYGHNRLILADGMRQLLRGGARLNWSDKLALEERRVIPVKKVLRLKHSLFKFVRTVADQMGVLDLDINPSPEGYGGRVLVVEGSYLRDRSLHDSLVQESRDAGNEPIDMLFIVSSKGVVSGGQGKSSVAGARFASWNYAIWDAVDSKNRSEYPVSLDQLRIVQYQSCRGLEGWTVVCLGFDEFWDSRAKQFQPSTEDTFGLSRSVEQQRKDFLASWAMIPLTRAIDTLVLEVPNRQHPAGELLWNCYQQCGDIVEWYTL